MNEFWILMEQIELFVIYMLVGVILIKSNVLTQTTIEVLARFVLKLALPLLIFTNTINGVDRTTLFQTLPVIGLAVIIYFLAYFLLLGMSNFFHLSGNVKNVYRALGMFGNIGFMGIPIISSIFPENGMLYISLFTIVDQLILWTLGVKLTTPCNGEKERFNPKKLINPATVAIVSAVLVILLNISIPSVCNIALSKIGAAATPLAMIYLGGIFACMDIYKYAKKLEFYGIVLIKMVVFPLLLFELFRIFPITKEIRMTAALLAAMPSMSSIVMMAKISGSEGEYAVGGISVTTIFSILTLPVVCWILQQL